MFWWYRSHHACSLTYTSTFTIPLPPFPNKPHLLPYGTLLKLTFITLLKLLNYHSVAINAYLFHSPAAGRPSGPRQLPGAAPGTAGAVLPAVVLHVPGRRRWHPRGSQQPGRRARRPDPAGGAHHESTHQRTAVSNSDPSLSFRCIQAFVKFSRPSSRLKDQVAPDASWVIIPEYHASTVFTKSKSVNLIPAFQSTHR